MGTGQLHAHLLHNTLRTCTVSVYAQGSGQYIANASNVSATATIALNLLMAQVNHVRLDVWARQTDEAIAFKLEGGPYTS